MQTVFPLDWTAAAERVATRSGVVLLIGAPDTGKSTFAKIAQLSLAAQGIPATVVDADLGQPQFGPPCCISMATGEITSIRPSPKTCEFIGSFSPAGRILETVLSIVRLTSTALASGAKLVLVDGLHPPSEPQGDRMIAALIRSLRPAALLLFERRDELAWLAERSRFRPEMETITLTVPDGIARRPAIAREQKRSAWFADYFRASNVAEFGVEKVALACTWMSFSNSLPAHRLRYASTAIGTTVYHGELCGGHLGVVVRRPVAGDEGLQALRDAFACRQITITPTEKLKGLLIGLEDEHGQTLGIGRLESLDFRKHSLQIQTTLRAPSAVKCVQFGLVCLRQDGVTSGHNRPGEV